jgi:hypothetical protein
VETLSIDELVAPLSPPRQETFEVLRELVRRVVPGAHEAVRTGWRLIGYRAPVGRRDVYFGFIMPEPHHVHLGFEYGTAMRDPEGVLQGAGRRVRYVTMTRPDEIPVSILEALVREGVRVASLTRAERLALLLDHEPEAVEAVEA